MSVMSARVTQPKYMRWLWAWRTAPKFGAQAGMPWIMPKRNSTPVAADKARANSEMVMKVRVVRRPIGGAF